jgi:hypothetical protein
MHAIPSHEKTHLHEGHLVLSVAYLHRYEHLGIDEHRMKEHFIVVPEDFIKLLDFCRLADEQDQRTHAQAAWRLRVECFVEIRIERIPRIPIDSASEDRMQWIL